MAVAIQRLKRYTAPYTRIQTSFKELGAVSSFGCVTNDQKIEYLAKNLKGLKEIILPQAGCSLHGDIDMGFIMEDGTHYTVPYNY